MLTTWDVVLVLSLSHTLFPFTPSVFSSLSLPLSLSARAASSVKTKLATVTVTKAATLPSVRMTQETATPENM